MWGRGLQHTHRDLQQVRPPHRRGIGAQATQIVEIVGFGGRFWIPWSCQMLGTNASATAQQLAKDFDEFVVVRKVGISISLICVSRALNACYCA